MIVSELSVYNFRRFQSKSGLPGLHLTFHKGLNALIGENDSGKTAVIDALKLILLTQSNEYIKPTDEDFLSLLVEMHVQSLRLIAPFRGLHRTKSKTLSNIFHLIRLKMALSIRLNFIIAHGKKVIKSIRNYVWAI